MLSIQVQLFISIAVMLLLFVSFLLVFILNQQKKLQYQKDMRQLHEKQQNQLIEAAVRSEETERHRIAEELHDEVGAFLSSSKLHFQGIKAALFDEHDKRLHAKGEELLDEAIQKVRGISHNLHSNILKEFGLNEAIRHFISKITTNALIHATIQLDNDYTTQNHDNDISIYRLVQELINNILKHAGATKLEVSSEYTSEGLKLTIFHNGRGLTQEQFERMRYEKEGLGLKNIQNRIILLRGKIEFMQSVNGYRIDIYIPSNTIAV